MRFIVLAITLLASGAGWAQQQQSPLELNMLENGYTRFPVLQCPATNEAIKNYRKKLQDLRQTIKSEANCQGITADVGKLAALVTDERPKFMELIAKGQAEGLNAMEQGKVEQYVNDLTVTSSNLIAVLTGNDACFDEDKKGMSLEFITSLVGEGAKVLSIFGGPQFGPIISIAGEVITGFMKAMQTIQNTRQGYRFHEADQRIAYAESLCSFYDYYREIDTVIAPYDSIMRLEQLQSVLNTQVNVLKNKCPECAEIVSLVDAEFARVSQNGALPIASQQQVWPPIFENQIAALARQIDALYTKNLGTHTYRALKTLTWIPLRIDALRSQEFTPDVVLATVMLEMSSVQRFMVDDQAPRFIQQLVANAAVWERDLTRQVASGAYTAYAISGYWVEQGGGLFGGGMDRATYYGSVFEALERAAETANESDRAKIRTFFKDLETKSRSLNISIDVASNYCNFFANAEWYRDGIAYQCSNAWFQDLKAQALLFTNYRSLMPSYQDQTPATPEAPPVVEDVAVDWAESLTRTVESMALDGEYVQRRDPSQLPR